MDEKLELFVSRIEGFDGLSKKEQIEWFGYYLINIAQSEVTIETIKEKLGDRYVAERDAMEIKYPITDPKADYADAAAYEKFIDEQMVLIAKDIGIVVN